MKMFKRFAAALLAGVMVLAMLTACGGGAGGSAMPTDDVEKAEVLYTDVFNAVLNSHYTNDADLKAKAKQSLDASLNEDGSLKDGKEMTVTLPSDKPSVETGITIIAQPGSKNTPYGQTSEQLTTAYNNRDEALDAVRNTVGTSADIFAAVTNLAVGAVKKGDKTYVALAMTLDLTKVEE